MAKFYSVSIKFIALAALLLSQSKSGIVWANTEEAEIVTEELECETPVVAEEEDPKCPSRPHIIRCAAHHLDTNKNGSLERAELQSAIDQLPWYSRGKY
jgi:hypothetical protein